LHSILKRIRPILGLLLLILIASVCVWAAYPATDNFTRTNSGTLGANWADSLGNTTPCQILSNTAANTSGGGVCSEVYNAETFNNDQYVQATFSNVTTSGTADIAVMIRTAVASANGYACGLRTALDGTHYVMWKLVSGSLSQIGVASSTVVANGDVVKFQVVGTTLNCYANGSLVLGPLTDSALSSGYPGLRGNNSLSGYSMWTLFSADCIPTCGGAAASELSGPAVIH